MKTKIFSSRWRGPVVAAMVMALAGVRGVAQTTPAPAQPAAPATAFAPVSSAATRATSPAAAGDIRDIRGPIHIPPPLLWPWWLAGAMALAAAGYGIWRWRRRRAQAAALLPYQIALKRLEGARALMQPANAREFSIRVSEIVRQFIEVRFAVRAARKTTEEFLRDLVAPSDNLLANHRESLAGFLRHCDLAKFARWILLTEEMTTMLQSAHHFVLQSGPTPPPTPATAAATAKGPAATQPIPSRP